MALKILIDDEKNIAKSFPKLNCSINRNVIWGTLEFACSYDCEKQELVYKDAFDNYIEDSYEIRIDFNEECAFGFPKVYEESGFIEDYAYSNAIKLDDLHINQGDGNSCCLGIFPEYMWCGAEAFIIEKVVPFFYWQSYKRIKGYEPWPGYAHGDDGIIESMCFSFKESCKGRNRNKLCPCGSGKKYKKCCLDRDLVLKRNIHPHVKIENSKKTPVF